jgi:hypothetical protein
MKELPGPTNIVHQMTETTITILNGEGELQNVMAKPMNGWSHFTTFSKTTAAHSLMDCMHFKNERGIEEVYTFENSCYACASASKESDPINSMRSRENKVPHGQQSKRAQSWKQHSSQRILRSVRSEHTAVKDGGGQTRECQLRFLR